METLSIAVAIIIAGYIIAQAIKEASAENKARIDKSIPDYQKRLEAIRDMINYKNNLFDIRDSKVEDQGSLEKAGNDDKEYSRKLKNNIAEYGKDMKKLSEDFDTRWSGDPYDPRRIPLAQFPEEVREQWQDVVDRR